MSRFLINKISIISIIMLILLIGIPEKTKAETLIATDNPKLRLMNLVEKKLALATVTWTEEVTETRPLTEKMKNILTESRLEGAMTGVSIRKVSDGELIYSHFGDTRLRPASNLKMITAAVALEKLGPGYQFKTEVATDGKLRNRVLEGNVFLIGKGDPTLLKEDFDQFAQDIKSKGIEKISGNLIADDSWFDQDRHSNGLYAANEDHYYGAEISALTLAPNDQYDAGTVVMTVTPGNKQGDAPQVEWLPQTDYIEIINEAETGSPDEVSTLTIKREHGTNRIFIEGVMALGHQGSSHYIALSEPTGYALDVFKKSLEENEIELAEDVELQLGVAPEDAHIITSKRSIPLQDLLLPFMKMSNNIQGEMLTKEMGKVIYGEGSWDAGIKVIEETIAEFGLHRNHIMIHDGSGLSHNNLVPPNEMTKMLHVIQDKSWFPAFEQSLPAVGEPGRLGSGTLNYRMSNSAAVGKVRAKTGNLTGVSSLSGYVTTADGEKLAFSIMMNNFIRGSMSEIQDQIVKMLAEHRLNN